MVVPTGRTAIQVDELDVSPTHDTDEPGGRRRSIWPAARVLAGLLEAAAGIAMAYGVTLGLILALTDTLKPTSALTTLVRGVNWHEAKPVDVQSAASSLLLLWVMLVVMVWVFGSIPLREAVVKATVLGAILLVSPWPLVAWICGLLVAVRIAHAVRSRVQPDLVDKMTTRTASTVTRG